MSLSRLYLLLLAFCCFVVLFEVLIAWPRETVELPPEQAPSWAPGSSRPELVREVAGGQTARA